ncbi:acylneuraminate cytidylyltransferase family protein, partial [bacterium]|nr:acylneuraminate cytidylyltransferase family protein [bacterium]
MGEKKLTNLAIIPARGGSKRLPGKNIKEINGKPLICYTIEAAINSDCFDTLLFSSDSEEILSVARRYEQVTIDRRPASLAGDKVKVIDAVCEIIDREEMQNRFDTVSLLLPTCPFRRASDIRKGFDLLDQSVDSVISATSFEFPIRMSFELAENTQELRYLFDPSPLVTGNTRSQDHAPV